MAAVYIVCSLIVIGNNFEAVGSIFGMIFLSGYQLRHTDNITLETI